MQRCAHVLRETNATDSFVLDCKHGRAYSVSSSTWSPLPYLPPVAIYEARAWLGWSFERKMHNIINRIPNRVRVPDVAMLVFEDRIDVYDRSVFSPEAHLERKTASAKLRANMECHVCGKEITGETGELEDGSDAFYVASEFLYCGKIDFCSECVENINTRECFVARDLLYGMCCENNIVRAPRDSVKWMTLLPRPR